MTDTKPDSDPRTRLTDLLRGRQQAVALLCIMAVTAVYVRFITGYIVFTGDQTQYLLLPFREIYRNFCPGDWLVWHTSHYHYIFSAFVKALYRVSAGHLELALLAVYGVFIFGFFHALYLLAEAFDAGFGSYALVILFLAFYTDVSLGGTPAYGRYVIPSFMATVLTLYAFALLVLKRHFTAIAVLASATLIHVNYGVLGVPLFAAYLALNRQDIRPRRLGAAALLFVVATLPTTVPTLLQFGGSSRGLWLVYYLRSPHHYNPLAFGISAWTFTLVPVLAAGIYAFRSPNATRPHRILSGLMAAFLLFFLITTAIDGPFIFKKVYPFRFSVYALLFSYLIIARALTVPAPARKYLAAALPAGLVLAAAAEGSGTVILLRHLFLAAAVATVVAVDGYLRGSRGSVPALTGLLAVFLVLGSGLRGKTVSAPHFAPASVHFREDLTEWIKRNLPADAVILSPPDLQGLRLNTHRSLVVNYKGVPMAEGREMLEWKKRLEDVTCSPPLEEVFARTGRHAFRGALVEYYLKTTPGQVRANMSAYGAGYFLTHNRHAGLDSFTTAGFRRMYRDGDVTLFGYEPEPLTGKQTHDTATE